MEDTLQEGIMSFDDLMAEGNSLEVETEGKPTEEAQEEGSAEPNQEEQEEQQEEQEEQEEQEGSEEGADPLEEEKPTEEGKPTTDPNNNSLSLLKQKLIEDGKWEDVVLNIDGEEVQLSELEDIDNETFLQIQEAQENLREEANKDKFIPKEGLNDISLKLIELQKSGGDISEAFQVYNEYVNPLEGLDLSNEKIQEQLVRRSLAKKVDDPEIVEMTIAKYKKDLVLDKKANDVVNFTKEAFNKFMDQKKTEAATKKQKEQESHGEYLNSLKKEQEALELKPEIKKQILELADKNENGEYRALDVVREQLQDPKLAQELLFFLNNRDAYKKSLGSKVKNETNLKTMKTVNIVKGKQKKQTGGTSKEEDLSGGLNFQEMTKL